MFGIVTLNLIGIMPQSFNMPQIVDTEECMSMNVYWTRLNMDWEHSSIDLDEETSAKFSEEKYRRNFPDISPSFSRTRESPYTLENFTANKDVDRSSDPPLIHSSLEETRDASTSPIPEDRIYFDSEEADSFLRIFDCIDELFLSVSSMSGTEAIKTIENPKVKDNDVSASFSNLSFDDTEDTGSEDRSVSDHDQSDSPNNISDINISDISLDLSQSPLQSEFQSDGADVVDDAQSETSEELESDIQLGTNEDVENEILEDVEIESNTDDECESEALSNFDEEVENFKCDTCEKYTHDVLTDIDEEEECELQSDYYEEVEYKVHLDTYDEDRSTAQLDIKEEDIENKVELETEEEADLTDYVKGHIENFTKVRSFWENKSNTSPSAMPRSLKLEDIQTQETADSATIAEIKKDEVNFYDSVPSTSKGTTDSACAIYVEITRENLSDNSEATSDGANESCYESFVMGAKMVENSDFHHLCVVPDYSFLEHKEVPECYVSLNLDSEKLPEWYNGDYRSLPADLESLEISQPPENDLQKNSADRVLSEHQLRVQRSLQKLNLPDWYKNSPVPREGFLLKKRGSDAGASSGWQASSLGSKTTSLGSLGGPLPPLLTPPQPHSSFTRWSTSRLNSAQTSPCSSARSSIRGSCASPLTSPARPPRAPRPSRQPYLGWRSQERLASPRTPHERLATSLLSQSPPVSANVSAEIQSSIKEVTSAIVHYVSGLEPRDRAHEGSPPRLCWLESSFVGTKPLESPQTPIVVAQLSPPRAAARPLQLELPRSNGSAHHTTHATTTYSHDWELPEQSLLNLAISKPSPGSTTLEDVLDSLLGLPPAAPSPQTSPRRSTSPYYVLGLQSRFTERSNSNTSSLQLSLSERPDYRYGRGGAAESPAGEGGDGGHGGRRKSSIESSSCSTLAAGTDGVDREENNSVLSLPKLRARAKSATPGKNVSRRQSEPAAAQKSVSLDRRVSYDSHLSRNDLSLSRTSLSDLQQSRASLKSIASINSDASGEEPLVHCRYTKCTSAATQTVARRYYKNCHNCSYVYCSRECRKAHWEKHRKVCLHSRASALCRQILSTAKEDTDSLHHISTIAAKGYLSNGRGVVKAFFTSPDAAEKFTTNGFQSLGEPIYVKWPDLVPTEMGPELYAELVKLCKSYNPEKRLVLFVAVCIISEVPTKGAVVKWERQLVSRCAKLRLSKTIMGLAPQTPFHSSPKARVRSKDKQQRDKDAIYRSENLETLILTSNSANLHRNNMSVQKIREISFKNIQSQLHQRGVNLKRHFPEVHAKLCSYVEGTCERFAPITVYPRDNLTGKSFMCVIMPEMESVKFDTLPSDSPACHTVDVSLDRSHLDQVSTPM